MGNLFSLISFSSFMFRHKSFEEYLYFKVLAIILIWGLNYKIHYNHI